LLSLGSRITTYDEVCGSYPREKPPVGMDNPEELEKWKKDMFNRYDCPFHKVEWNRIVLDGTYLSLTQENLEIVILIGFPEAHAIKNKDSATSIAVRDLKGKFKWVISGTPLHK
jgi:SNF2 family DNA or RNA helicase